MFASPHQKWAYRYSNSVPLWYNLVVYDGIIFCEERKPPRFISNYHMVIRMQYFKLSLAVLCFYTTCQILNCYTLVKKRPGVAVAQVVAIPLPSSWPTMSQSDATTFFWPILKGWGRQAIVLTKSHSTRKISQWARPKSRKCVIG